MIGFNLNTFMRSEIQQKRYLEDILKRLSKKSIKEKDIENLKEIITETKDNDEEYYYIIHTFLGIFYFQIKEYNQAIIYFKIAADEYGDEYGYGYEVFHIAKFYMGLICYCYLNDIDKALEYLDKIKSPSKLLQSLFSSESLSNLYEKYFKDSFYYKALVYVCYTHEVKSRDDIIIKSYQNLIEYYEDRNNNHIYGFEYYLEANFNLGLIYYKKYIKENKNREESIKYFEKYIKELPDNKDYKRLIIAKLFLIKCGTSSDDKFLENFKNYYQNNNIDLLQVFNVIYSFLIDDFFNDDLNKLCSLILESILLQVHKNVNGDKRKNEQNILLQNRPFILENYPFTLFNEISKININNKKFNCLLSNLIVHCTSVLKHLFIDVGKNQVSHYTSYNVAEKLLSNESKFRLGLADFMNDPTEGQVLSKFLEYNIRYNDIYIFLASFSFNIKNLNLFRLYGKKDYKEGTGLSLVIKENFLGSISIESKKNKLDLLPLYRCIYINPEKGYINIASKNENSFYQELKSQGKTDAYIKSKFKDYQKDIKNKLKDLKIFLEAMKKDLVILKNTKFYKDNKDNEEVLDNLISLILLPIRFLVKYSDFEEEAECRVIYPTTIIDSRIHNEKDTEKLYMEYQFISNSISEIYLGPKISGNDKMILDYLCNNEKKLDIKIKKSKLPLA